MENTEKKSLVETLRELPALCIAMVFVGFYELEKLAKRVRGAKEAPRPKASIRKRAKLQNEIFG